MATLQEMGQRGVSKFKNKLPTMKANYDASKARMKTNYGNLPFGPNTKAAYNRGIDAAVYRAPDGDKWLRNWTAAMSR